ncbi:MAG TPA: O-antigen ligase family protein [Pyrinomonadaceae bacterium]|nr:O-antigen ligase family protein [Pyrinomonadaceae bacterium]
MEANTQFEILDKPFAAESVLSNVCAVLFGLGLLSILFYVPGPVIPVSHPYKAELVLSVLLAVVWFGIWLSGAKITELIGGLGRYSFRFSKWLTAFALFGLISAVWAYSLESVFHHTVIWALYIAAFVTFAAIVRWQGSIRFPLVAITTAATITGILCLIDYLTLTDFKLSEGFLRIRYGKYGELMATISPVLAAGAIFMKGRVRWLVAAAFLLAWITVMLSLSKGSFLAGIIGMSVFFIGALVFKSVGKRKVVAAIAAAWLIFTVGFQVLFVVTSDVPATADYITGTQDPEFTSSEFRVVVWKVGIHMAKERWLIGHGADSFGRAFNDGRMNFRRDNPQDTSTEYGEDYLVERAHNEPIQILSELGIVGFSLIFVAFGGLAVALFKQIRGPNSVVIWSVFGGIAAFAVSSMVSSFSFRSAQNGMGLFLILSAAIGVSDSSLVGEMSSRLRRGIFWLMVVGIVACLAYAGIKIAEEVYVNRAEMTIDHDSALADYRVALMLDPEYAGAYSSAAARYAAMNEYLKAAEMTRKGIVTGIGMSLTYSQLATQYKTAGAIDQAVEAYREATTVYPRSIYLRIEAAEFMRSVGLEEEAKAQTEAAFAVNAKQAEGWIRLIRYKSTKAFHMSKVDGLSTPPGELIPQNAAQMYTDSPPIPPE